MKTELKTLLTKAVISYINDINSDVVSCCNGVLSYMSFKDSIIMQVIPDAIKQKVDAKVKKLRESIQATKGRCNYIIAAVADLKAEGIIEGEEITSLEHVINQWDEIFKDLSIDEDGTVHVPEELKNIAAKNEGATLEAVIEPKGESEAPASSEEPHSTEEQK